MFQTEVVQIWEEGKTQAIWHLEDAVLLMEQLKEKICLFLF